MKTIGKLIVVLALSLVLHLLLGWMWTAVAGIVAGLWTRRYGWLIGSVGVALGWAVLVAYSFYVAPYPTSEMARIFGAIVGNLPAAVTVAATIVIGGVIGGLGGATGNLIAASLPRRAHAGATS